MLPKTPNAYITDRKEIIGQLKNDPSQFVQALNIIKDTAPIKQDEAVGTVAYSYNGTTVLECDLLASRDVAEMPTPAPSASASAEKSTKSPASAAPGSASTAPESTEAPQANGGGMVSTLIWAGAIILLLLLQMLPSMLVMVPIFLIYKGLNINNTLFGLIVCYATSSLAFCIWMLKGFFDSVPFEVEESAMIDGCSQFSSFVRIILPVSTPGLATVAIFSFVRAWNEYVMARILIQSDELKTINLGLQKFVQEFQVDWSLLSAGAVIATVPTILFLLFAQKYLVQGLTSGAIKG
jgi:ABC-type molybdate transport system permease subunit